MSRVPGRIGGSESIEGIKYILSIIKERDIEKDYLNAKIKKVNDERTANGIARFSCYSDETDLISFIRLKVPLIEKRKKEGQFMYNLTALGEELTEYLYNDPQFKRRLLKELQKYSKTTFTYFDSALPNIFKELESGNKVRKKKLNKILEDSCNGNYNAIRGCKGLLEGTDFLIDEGENFVINPLMAEEIDEGGVLEDMLIELKDKLLIQSGEEWINQDNLIESAKNQLSLASNEVNEIMEKLIKSGRLVKKPESRWDRRKIYVK